MKLFVLTNHSVSEEQRADAQINLGVTEFVELPANLKVKWSEVPPEVDSIADFVRPYLEWLEVNFTGGDSVWVQGEWGVTASVMGWCQARNVRCVYATTKRVAREMQTASGLQLVHVFKHVRFRDYPKI